MTVVQAGSTAEATGPCSDFERARATNPTEFRAYGDWARCLAQAGQYEAALAQYKIAASVNPPDVKSYYEMAKLLTVVGRPAEALQTYNEIAEKVPDFVASVQFADFFNDWGDAAAGAGRFEEALDQYKRALEKEPDNGSAHVRAARIYEQLGESARATAEYEQADRSYSEFVNRDPSGGAYPDAMYYDWGLVAQRLQRPEQAIEHFQRAISINPRHLDALIDSSRLLEQLGRADEAREFRDRALSIDRQYVESRLTAATLTAAEQSTVAQRPPTPRDRTPIHQDEPAVVDELHRRSFAQVLAKRIWQIWSERDARSRMKSGATSSDQPSESFFMHVHGPWGTGKTTLLGFIRKELQEPTWTDDDDRDGAPTTTNWQPWVVVDFNAWRYQRMRPPWWALIQEVQRQAVEQLEERHPLAAWSLRWNWAVWRFRADWLPVILATGAVALALWLVISAVVTSTTSVSTSSPDAMSKALDLGLKLVAALLASWFAALAAGRSLLFGSSRASQVYLELSIDPLRAIVQLFDRLVRSIGQPVAILIDDLDRCDGPYVVQLLEGIQTLFRGAPVTYVVAADRDWIRSSFEKAYEQFAPTVGEWGRPLGHLFLEKLFQVSAEVPRLPLEVRKEYWRRLLRDGGAQSPEELEKTRRALANDARAIVGGLTSKPELDQVIDQNRGNPALEEEIRALAARKITNLPDQKEIENLLQPYQDRVEANPRAMKRLVNAFGLKQAVLYLEHRDVDIDRLARLTIIEMRWPLLAEALAVNPSIADWFVNRTVPDDEKLDEALSPLLRDDNVHDVLGGSYPLDTAAVRDIYG